MGGGSLLAGLLVLPAVILVFASARSAPAWPLINLVGTDKLRAPLSYYATFTKEVDGGVISETVKLRPGEDANEVVGPFGWRDRRPVGVSLQ